MQLAATCALEHFTAILANAVLSDPAHLVGADTEAQRMWRWHAVEEIEHKAVAYDTWLYATRAMPRWRSEEHTSELQSLMRISYAVFCLKKKKHNTIITLNDNEK